MARCAMEWVEGSVGTSSFGWFLRGLGWFLLVEDKAKATKFFVVQARPTLIFGKSE